MSMNNSRFKFFLGYLILLITSAVFLISGYTKLVSIEMLEIILVEKGIVGWSLAPFFARLFISAEFLIGVGLVIPSFSKLSSKFGIFLLFIFSFYLIYLWIIEGGDTNCGCFGLSFYMNIRDALIKNLILVVLLFISFYILKFKATKAPSLFISIVVVICICVAPFVFVPIISSNIKSTNNLKNENLDFVVVDSFKKKYPISFGSNKGKKVIAFLSLTCIHCRLGARKLQTIKLSHPKLPIYFVLNGERHHLMPFYKETKTKDIPSVFLSGNDFVNSAGLSLPVILLINDNKIEYRLRYTELDELTLEKWFSDKR